MMLRLYQRFHLYSMDIRLPHFHVGKQRQFLMVRNASNTVVKSPYLLDESMIPNIPFGKFVMSRYERNSSWKDELVMVDGTKSTSITYGQAYDMIYRTASALRKLGVTYNYGVAILTPNHLNFFSIFMATSLTGGYTISINPLSNDDELAYQLELAEAKILFVYPLFIQKVLPIASKLKIRVISIDGSNVEGVPSFDEFISQENLSMIDISSFPPSSQKFDYNSTAVIPFSSGTTGKSKGVMLTHRNLMANIVQAFVMEPSFLSREDGKRLINLIPLPFFHIFGMMCGMCMPMYSGGLSVSMSSFDLQKYLELIQQYKVRRAFVVPPIVIALVKHPIVSKYDLSSLESIVSGAAPLSGELRTACAKRLRCSVTQGWGLTETSPACTVLLDSENENPVANKGSCGKLLPGTEGKIVHPETGVDLLPTEEGEVLIRGPQVMKGYLKNPEATKSTLRSDGWLHTGDIGHFDENGYLYITDRSKELIKYKGFQVPPAELEAILLTMPQLKDAIVIPVLDEEAGEIPRAYVVKQDNVPESFTEKDVVEYVNSKVAPHKRLRGGVKFATSVPKSPAGKLLRRLQVQMDRGELKQ